MTIIQLEYVIAVDTYKNFAEAAKSCFVTQPTLSMQIKKLEEEMNILLFDRSKKPVMTTEIGRKVIDQAKIGLKELRRIKELVNEEKETVSGELRIGIIPTLSPYLLPLFVASFIKKHPDVHLVFEELLTEQIAAKLNNDLLDVGILVSPLENKNLVEQSLFYESFVLYISTLHPLNTKSKISLKDLSLKDMWLLKEGHCFRSQTINICSENMNEKQGQNPLRFESGHIETLKKIVEQDFGYTLLPELALNGMSAENKKRVRVFESPVPVREVSFVTHRSYLKQKLIGLLKEEIQASLPKEMLVKKEQRLIKW